MKGKQYYMIKVIAGPYTEHNIDSRYSCRVQMDLPEEVRKIKGCGKVTNPYKDCKNHKYISRIIFENADAKKAFVASYR